MPELEPISPLNTNYDPPRPWSCATHAEHACSGPVVGRVGAYPVCAAGAPAEILARTADAARIARLAVTMRAELEREQRMERKIEMG